MNKKIILLAGAMLSLIIINQQKKQQNFFHKITKALKKNNIELFKTVTMNAKSVGAIEGFKFITSHGNFEIYRFDKNNKQLNLARTSSLFTVDNVHYFKVFINQEYVLPALDIHPDIIEIFKSIY